MNWQNWIDVVDEGMDGVGSAEDTSENNKQILENIINNDQNRNKTIYFRSGVYHLSQLEKPLILKDNVRLLGERSVLKYMGQTGTVIRVGGDNMWDDEDSVAIEYRQWNSIEQLTFEAPEYQLKSVEKRKDESPIDVKPEDNVFLEICGAYHSRFSQLLFQNMPGGTAIKLLAANHYNRFESIAMHQVYYGIYIESKEITKAGKKIWLPSNNNVFDNLRIYGEANTGIYFKDCHASMVKFRDCDIDAVCRKSRIKIGKGTGFVIFDSLRAEGSNRQVWEVKQGEEEVTRKYDKFDDDAEDFDIETGADIRFVNNWPGILHQKSAASPLADIFGLHFNNHENILEGTRWEDWVKQEGEARLWPECPERPLWAVGGSSIAMKCSAWPFLFRYRVDIREIRNSVGKPSLTGFPFYLYGSLLANEERIVQLECRFYSESNQQIQHIDPIISTGLNLKKYEWRQMFAYGKIPEQCQYIDYVVHCCPDEAIKKNLVGIVGAATVVYLYNPVLVLPLHHQRIGSQKFEPVR